jgi:hypothetical protein
MSYRTITVDGNPYKWLQNGQVLKIRGIGTYFLEDIEYAEDCTDFDFGDPTGEYFIRPWGVATLIREELQYRKDTRNK